MKVRRIFRSSITGKFVPMWVAKFYPRETQEETIKEDDK